MITLTTGVPGSGKSLLTIARVKEKVETENAQLVEQGKELRPVFYFGIADLKLDWQLLEKAEAWTECPVGSIIVIDECQTVFRPRAAGSAVPKHISELETHRHKGFDIFLITQHPMLVDQNIRRLVGCHWHVIRKFGLMGATVCEWGSAHEITKRNVSQSVRTEWRYPKEVFSYYKSAEMHTHKRKIPKRVYFLLLAPFLLIGLLFAGYKIVASFGASKPATVEAKPALTTPTGTASPSANNAGPISTAEYIALYQPRIQGMPWTAPAYDEVTKPVQAPEPQTCLINHKTDTCRCLDQQGNALYTGDGFCRSFVSKGMFVPWREKPAIQQAQQVSKERQAQPMPQQSSPSIQPQPMQPIQPVALEQNPRPIPADSPWRFKG